MMTIQEATAKAMEQGRAITRRSWKGHAFVRPTNTPDCCFLFGSGEAPGPRWNPKAGDLMADDWDVAFNASSPEAAEGCPNTGL